MSKITKIDRQTCKRLRPLIDSHLATLGHNLGLKIEAGNATYDPAGFVTFKVKCQLEGFDADKHDWDQNCWQFNLQEDHFGAEIAYGGNRYKLVGISPRSRKYPIIAERLEGAQGGKWFKLPERAIARLAAGETA